MRHLKYATEPTPTWFARFDTWRVGNDLVQIPEDLTDRGMAVMPPVAPRVGYLWTSDGRFLTDDYLILIQALRHVGQLQIWSFPPVSPKIAHIVAVRKVFGDHEPLRRSATKIERTVRTQEGDTRYWGAIVVDETNLGAAVEFMTRFGFGALLIAGTRADWKIVAARVANDLELERLGRLWSVKKYNLLNFVAELASSGGLLVWFYDHISDQVRRVAVLHGHADAVEAFGEALQHLALVERVDVRDLGRDE